MLVIVAALVAWTLVALLAFGPDHDAYLRGAQTANEHLERERQWEIDKTRQVETQGELAASVLGIASVFYFIGFWAWRGQTPGMMFLGIRIVKADGSRIGFGRAALHYLGTIASTVIVFIGYLMIIWDKRKQGLHDKISHTYVVRT